MNAIWRMIMFRFLLTMWLLGKVGEADVDMAVSRGIISEMQGDEIKATVR